MIRPPVSELRLPGNSPGIGLDTSRSQSARRYDAWLGGKDNFAADRASAQQIADVFPTVAGAARENRRWLNRVVTFLARDAGVGTFVDIGCGLPAAPNVHEIAHAVAPAARVVYVDNDPVVMAHARARLSANPPGTVGHVQADLRHPDTILNDPTVAETLGLGRPVGLLLAAVLHFLPDSDHPYECVAQLIAALPAGSYVAISHATFDLLPDQVATELAALSRPETGHGTFRARSRDEVARLIEGLELVEPGLVSVVDWYPECEPVPAITAAEAATWVALARTSTPPPHNPSRHHGPEAASCIGSSGSARARPPLGEAAEHQQKGTTVNETATPPTAPAATAVLDDPANTSTRHRGRDGRRLRA